MTVTTFLQGELIGIIGTVGSGKSSLLNAIVAEMRRRSGVISIANLEEGFGLVGQEAWIQVGNASFICVHRNVLRLSLN